MAQQCVELINSAFLQRSVRLTLFSPSLMGETSGPMHRAPSQYRIVSAAPFALSTIAVPVPHADPPAPPPSSSRPRAQKPPNPKPTSQPCTTHSAASSVRSILGLLPPAGPPKPLSLYPHTPLRRLPIRGPVPNTLRGAPPTGSSLIRAQPRRYIRCLKHRPPSVRSTQI